MREQYRALSLSYTLALSRDQLGAQEENPRETEDQSPCILRREVDESRGHSRAPGKTRAGKRAGTLANEASLCSWQVRIAGYTPCASCVRRPSASPIRRPRVPAAYPHPPPPRQRTSKARALPRRDFGISHRWSNRSCILGERGINSAATYPGIGRERSRHESSEHSPRLDVPGGAMVLGDQSPRMCQRRGEVWESKIGSASVRSRDIRSRWRKRKDNHEGQPHCIPEERKRGWSDLISRSILQKRREEKRNATVTAVHPLDVHCRKESVDKSSQVTRGTVCTANNGTSPHAERLPLSERSSFVSTCSRQKRRYNFFRHCKPFLY